jgi:hypothetical protein
MTKNKCRKRRGVTIIRVMSIRASWRGIVNSLIRSSRPSGISRRIVFCRTVISWARLCRFRPYGPVLSVGSSCNLSWSFRLRQNPTENGRPVGEDVLGTDVDAPKVDNACEDVDVLYEQSVFKSEIIKRTGDSNLIHNKP